MAQFLVAWYSPGPPDPKTDSNVESSKRRDIRRRNFLTPSSRSTFWYNFAVHLISSVSIVQSRRWTLSPLCWSIWQPVAEIPKKALLKNPYVAHPIPSVSIVKSRISMHSGWTFPPPPPFSGPYSGCRRKQQECEPLHQALIFTADPLPSFSSGQKGKLSPILCTSDLFYLLQHVQLFDIFSPLLMPEPHTVHYSVLSDMFHLLVQLFIPLSWCQKGKLNLILCTSDAQSRYSYSDRKVSSVSTNIWHGYIFCPFEHV